ncbi:hypothetical protein UFOVP978_24 [uncultured Caudovirales phage]|uniref:Uncharacterized protein n=1 Tax=uncultured Caudovirales phage TaxID=2100421 RepID=A0A6J5Q485_9CAUD|nr:hypothetical protein UFOVP978_24 [uncultured Caudovirales phage]
MGFSYTLPPTSSLDTVRFLVGDTIEDDYRIEDEEITLCLSQSGSDEYFAAAMACEFIATKFSAKGRKSVGALTVEYSQMASDYNQRAATLRLQAFNRPGQAAAPYVGGISVADKEGNQQDDDWDRTAISLGFTDVKGTKYINDYPWNLY